MIWEEIHESAGWVEVGRRLGLMADSGVDETRAIASFMDAVGRFAQVALLTDEEVRELLEAFSREHLTPELAGYILKLWEQISRKRNYVITGGKPEIWASAVVYVIARLNFLFDRSQGGYGNWGEVTQLADPADMTARGSVLLGAASENARAAESQKLLNWGFTAYEAVRLSAAGGAVVTPRVWKGRADQAKLGRPEGVVVSVPAGTPGCSAPTRHRTRPRSRPSPARRSRTRARDRRRCTRRRKEHRDPRHRSRPS